MGLDSVEILVEVEKTFGINIPDREAEKISTVGEFHNAVWQYVQQKQTATCKSQALFYRLRQSFCNTFMLPKQSFILEASLNDLFPKENRRTIYRDFVQTSGLELPELTLTKRAARLLTIIGITTILGGILTALILVTFFDFTKWLYTLPLIGIFITVATSKLFNPYRTVIAPASVREFTETSLKMNYSTFAKEQGVNRKEMEIVINHIIADRAGLDLEEITPEKRITDDLGID